MVDRLLVISAFKGTGLTFHRSMDPFKGLSFMLNEQELKEEVER